jgi:hypothetical protein
MVVKEIDTQAKRIVVDAQALGLRGELADDENPDN